MEGKHVMEKGKGEKAGSKTEYRLIAFDMDGTLLNSEKKADSKTKRAVHEAVLRGKTAVYCTGRAPSELADYRSEFPEMRYAICNNGALIWDMIEERPVFCHLLPADQIGRILKEAESEECLFQIYTEREMLYNDYSEEKIVTFAMGEFLPLYRKVVKRITGFESDYRNYQVCKLSIHMKGPEARERLKDRIGKLNLPVEVRRANRYTLEVTDRGVSKAYGLEHLCGMLDIPLQETIAIGDSGNDIDVLEKAGLGIAMANAVQEVKNVAKAVVADNDHSGCAEAVEKYLLS